MIVTTNSVLHDHADPGAYEAAIHGIARSNHFGVMQRKAREEDSSCVITGLRQGTEWHHSIVPFHIARLIGRWELEFSPRNLIFLLQLPSNEYHRIVGHLLFFQSYNPNITDHVKKYKRWSINRIMTDQAFQDAIHKRPKSWRDMSEAEKNEVVKRVDLLLPRDKNELKLFAKYKPTS